MQALAALFRFAFCLKFMTPTLTGPGMLRDPCMQGLQSVVVGCRVCPVIGSQKRSCVGDAQSTGCFLHLMKHTTQLSLACFRRLVALLEKSFAGKAECRTLPDLCESRSTAVVCVPQVSSYPALEELCRVGAHMLVRLALSETYPHAGVMCECCACPSLRQHVAALLGF
eukprot:1161474-Pelagomonas_calceolata.AAC.10